MLALNPECLATCRKHSSRSAAGQDLNSKFGTCIDDVFAVVEYEEDAVGRVPFRQLFVRHRGRGNGQPDDVRRR